MALMKQCPGCKKRCSANANECPKCGKTLAKQSGVDWWISYYDINKTLVRKKIGPSRVAAEQELRKQLTARTEGRHIQESVDAKVKFGDLAKWYLELPEVRKKRSYKRDCQTIKTLVSFFGAKMLCKITPGLVDSYREKRLVTPSGRTPDTMVQPSSVNREISCLRSIFNRAIRHGMAEKNPVQLKMLKENNSRDMVLTPEQYDRLLASCRPYLKPIVQTAYRTGMRKGEIIPLVWGKVDLKGGLIHLKHQDTKTNEGRSIPLCQELLDMFRAMPRGLPGAPVFTRNGQHVKCIREAFAAACKKAGIENFVFHDLRHCFCTNAFKAGLPALVVMKISGHKTMAMFKRYTSIQPQDLKEAIAKMG